LPPACSIRHGRPAACWVALFGSLIGQTGAFTAGKHAALAISAAALLTAAVAIWRGGGKVAQP
jgi:hypothetical protein